MNSSQSEADKDDNVAITVNETLSRGLAKRATREASAIFQAQLLRTLDLTPDKMGLRRLYRERCHGIRTGFNDAIVLEKSVDSGKNSETQFYCWGAHDERIALYLIGVPFRPKDLTLIVLLEVTRHATERIFERLNTTDINIVQNELTTCALTSVYLLISKVVDNKTNTGIRHTTPNGTAVIKREEGGPLAVITWLPAKPGSLHKPSEAEEEMWEEVLNFLGKTCTGR